MLLAIDTSAGTSVAVVDRERGILAERVSTDPRLHAEVIGVLLSEALDAAGIRASDLSAVAAGMGPGPFTGLRVGIAAAETFALAVGRPVVRVPSHDAIAFEHYGAAASGPLLIVTDARRREVYWSAYSGAGEWGIPDLVDGPGFVRPDELSAAVPGFDDYRRIDATSVSAGALGMLAERLFECGRPFAAREPLYLRAPDAVASTTSKRVS